MAQTSDGTFVARGFNEIEAILSPVAVLLGALVIGGGLHAVFALDLGTIAALTCLALVLFAGARYRLTISPTGIELVRFQCWLVPTKREHFPLDAAVDLYWPFESDHPEGLCICPPWGWGERETDCFGPSFQQARIARLHEAANEALARMRAEVGPPPASPAFHLAAELADALEPSGRERWSGSGRLKSARLARELSTGGVTLPAGSTLEFNHDGWIDPRRPDRLSGATIAAPTTLPIPSGHRAEAGAKLWFGEDGQCSSVRDAFPAPTRIGRVVVHPTETLRWSASGEITGFALGETLDVGGVAIPAGSRFTEWTLLSTREWYVNLSGAVSLPQLTLRPGDTLRVTRDFSRITAVGRDEDVVVDGVTLKSGILQFPLDEELRIDLAWCRKNRLVR